MSVIDAFLWSTTKTTGVGALVGLPLPSIHIQALHFAHVPCCRQPQALPEQLFSVLRLTDSISYASFDPSLLHLNSYIFYAVSFRHVVSSMLDAIFADALLHTRAKRSSSISFPTNSFPSIIGNGRATSCFISESRNFQGSSSIAKYLVIKTVNSISGRCCPLI